MVMEHHLGLTLKEPVGRCVLEAAKGAARVRELDDARVLVRLECGNHPLIIERRHAQRHLGNGRSHVGREGRPRRRQVLEEGRLAHAHAQLVLEPLGRIEHVVHRAVKGQSHALGAAHATVLHLLPHKSQ